MSGVKTEISITQKYQRGTFERSNSSAISEMTKINSAIAEKDSVKIVAAWSFKSQTTM